jgi:hypothetical protein
VNWLYRNVICPWQTEREIKSAEKFIDRMLFKATDEEKLYILRYDQERDWGQR